MDHDGQQPSLSIDQDVAPAPRDFLAAIKPFYPARLSFDGLDIDNGYAFRVIADGHAT